MFTFGFRTCLQLYTLVHGDEHERALKVPLTIFTNRKPIYFSNITRIPLRMIIIIIAVTVMIVYFCLTSHKSFFLPIVSRMRSQLTRSTLLKIISEILNVGD